MKPAEIEKKTLTHTEAAQVYGGKEASFRKLCRSSQILIKKCTDGKWRGTPKQWEKLLGLAN